jgi:hypothetical protein
MAYLPETGHEELQIDLEKDRERERGLNWASL